MASVAVNIHVYRKPKVLGYLLDNIKWSGWPDVPIRVFEDPSPFEDRRNITEAYQEICNEWKVPFETANEWGHMRGVSEFAMKRTSEDWIIWVPDDVIFTRGGLWNEVAGVLTFGKPFIGGIQMPYWNSQDLSANGLLPVDPKPNGDQWPFKSLMLKGWKPENVPRNPYWDAYGLPRCYANFNGAGFAINRILWKRMGGYHPVTSRLDEYAGFKAWQLGMPVITLPGPPRIHYFGGSAELIPVGGNPSDLHEYEQAMGMSLEDACTLIHTQRSKIPATAADGSFNDVLAFFQNGGSLV